MSVAPPACYPPATRLSGMVANLLQRRTHACAVPKLGVGPVTWGRWPVQAARGLYGSCRPGHQAERIHVQCANMRGYLLVISCSVRWAFFDPRSRLYSLRIQRAR